jgi:ParB-like chromosome segregation protein Spo0J
MLEIEYMSTSELIPYANNAKLHTPEQIEQIKKSIQEFGMCDPVAIWDEDGTIIEGHGRVMACEALGIDQVPVIRLKDLTDEQRRAYALVHNKLTMDTDFDYDMLMTELEDVEIDLSEYGFDYEAEDEDADGITIENKEYNVNDFQDEKFDYECEECGFRFNA